jgi:hypothetical protein
MVEAEIPMSWASDALGLAMGIDPAVLLLFLSFDLRACLLKGRRCSQSVVQ